MRKLLAAVLFVPATLFAMGGQPEVGTLTPAKIVDAAGKVHTVAGLVCNDKNYFSFTDGAVKVKIPFTKIEKVVFLKEGGKILAKVYLKNGEIKEFFIEPDTECVGMTEYGTVEAPVSAIKEIDFLPPQGR